jgi:two-component system OmpR family sensor kinase
MMTMTGQDNQPAYQTTTTAGMMVAPPGPAPLELVPVGTTMTMAAAPAAMTMMMTTEGTAAARMTTTAVTTDQPRWKLGLRLRLLGWALSLLAVASIASVVVIRQVLVNQLENRVATDMRQEVSEFRRLVDAWSPGTGRPPGDDLRAIADSYLTRNEMSTGESVLVFVEGQFYQGTSTPGELGLPAAQVAEWTTLTTSRQGQIDDHQQGPAHWLVTPVSWDGQTYGQFVVTGFTAGQYADIEHAVQLMGLSCLLVIVVVAAGGYLAMGRALRPLRNVTEAAQVISETDLARRISVTGTDEVAVLSRTFNTMLGRLERAFQTQQAFLSDAGHELRTPITIVRGHLEVMGDDPLERAETIALVTDELDRMNRMVNDLLMLARAEQPDFLQPAPADAAALMDDVFVKASALGNRDWRLNLSGPAWVWADRQRLTQAVMQLAQNAVQFTAEHGRIELAVAVTGQEVQLSVTDDGIGVEPQDRDRIFGRFARAAHRTEGTGLGLAIVAAIAQAHNGRVELESVPGGGSTFTITLPRDGGEPK